jgi:hypothetical protein
MDHVMPVTDKAQKIGLLLEFRPEYAQPKGVH